VEYKTKVIKVITMAMRPCQDHSEDNWTKQLDSTTTGTYRKQP